MAALETPLRTAIPLCRLFVSQKYLIFYTGSEKKKNLFFQGMSSSKDFPHLVLLISNDKFAWCCIVGALLYNKHR